LLEPLLRARVSRRDEQLDLSRHVHGRGVAARTGQADLRPGLAVGRILLEVLWFVVPLRFVEDRPGVVLRRLHSHANGPDLVHARVLQEKLDREPAKPFVRKALVLDRPRRDLHVLSGKKRRNDE
jgi:hypothetical protein